MKDVSGAINVDALNPTGASVKFSVETSSVETGSSELDYALRSAALLDAAKFPQITFESRVINSTATTNVYQISGDLTLHGVTKRVVLSWLNSVALSETRTDGRVSGSRRERR